MKLPPLLLGATLVFWGWETNLLGAGALLAVIFEGAQRSRFRWVSTDDDLNRLWNLVTVVFLAAAVFAFTSNEGPDAFSDLFQDPGIMTSRLAGESGQKTAASLIQWMPMIFFLFLMAVTLGRQSTVKLKVLSLIARRQRPGQALSSLAHREIHIGWLYFAVCLVSSSINTRTDGSFFAGLACLITWALWTRRNRRFAIPVWAGAVAVACLMAYWGQGRLGELRNLVDSFTPRWGWRAGGRANPNQDRTAIGQIGLLKGSGRIVVRITPEEGAAVPTLLRSATYRYFRSPSWRASMSSVEVEPSAQFGGVDYGRSGSWRLRPTTAESGIQISAYLESSQDILPLPMGVCCLENLTAVAVATNGLGAVTAKGPAIVVFDALYSKNGSFDSPPDRAGDLWIPPTERAAVESVVEGLDLEGKDLAHKLRTVSGFFQDNFKYSLWQGISLRRGDLPTPLARFLLDTRSGHCEYFATATVLMLRQMEIPARYAVGWAVEETSGKGYVIRERHAHAWCIYYDEADKQWHEFDTTPASWLKEEDSRASIFEFLTDIWQWIKFEFTKWRWGQSHLRDYVWWIIGPMLVFLLYRLLRRKSSEKAGPNLSRVDRLPSRLGLDSEFYLVEKKLGELGFIRERGETQAAFIERAVKDVHVGALREVLFGILRAHYRLRFDPMGLTPGEREALGLRVQEAMEHLAQPKVPV